MSLDAGTRLGPYEIGSPLGAGGMGEVYRARDTKLDRDVAIKVLPEELAGDVERVARFEREAKLLASLNHPNIASIYGFESRALVLELVEGLTLAERIEQGTSMHAAGPHPHGSRSGDSAPARRPRALPLDEALAIAKQIAEALEAGHDAGIIHRDLKPANIKVREDGTVKVLDYGLAKALEGDSSNEGDSELSQSPTLTRQGTQVGVILGTAAYMSPEQAKGKRVDTRADIWAFGAVVYEMLTGKRAFGGDDVSDTLAAVLRAEPDLEALPAETPSSLRMVLRLCLRKDVTERMQSIGDVRLAMKGAFETERSLEPTVAAPAELAVWQRPLPALLIALLFAAAAGLAVWSAARPPASSSPVSRFTIELPEAQALTNIERRGLAVSPLGTHVVYVANQQLYLRAFDELSTRVVAGTEGSAPSLPFFSPDGQWVAFYSNRENRLKKIALTGGAAVTLCESENPMGASWGPDDRIVFGQRQGIFQVSAAGGASELIVPIDEDAGEVAGGPKILPDGRTVLFTLRGDYYSRSARIVAQSMDTSERRLILDDGSDARYLPTGHLVYTSARNLLAVPFDLDRLEVIGGAVPLIEDVARTWGGMAAQYDVSRDGVLVYLGGGADRAPVWVNRQGIEEPIGAELGRYVRARISPDGTHAVFDIRGDLWVWDFARASSTRLTFEGGSQPEWTPDGRSVVFTKLRGGTSGLFRKAADGTGVVERLTEAVGVHWAEAFTRDGSRLVFLDASGGSRDFHVLSLDDELAVGPLLETGAWLDDATLSPDGRWLAYESRASGVGEIYVRPFPNVDDGRWQISTGSGERPLWGPDANELFFRTLSSGELMRVAIDTEPAFRYESPESLFPAGSYFRGGNERSFDISPDGQRFLMIKRGAATGAGDPSTGLNRFVVVLNWTEELKRLVPSPP